MTEGPQTLQHAQLDWPEGGGVMLGAHRPDGPFVQPEVQERDYGSREVAIVDPEGNQWSFGTYAGAPRR